jgi:hypothetical protein
MSVASKMRRKIQYSVLTMKNQTLFLQKYKKPQIYADLHKKRTVHICSVVEKKASSFYIRHLVSLAGAPGFEPRSTDPKSGVLPLHHAPPTVQSEAGKF